MELIIHFTALPEKLTLDMVKSDLAELLEDDGWLTGSGADYLELELEDEKVNPQVRYSHREGLSAKGPVRPGHHHRAGRDAGGHLRISRGGYFYEKSHRHFTDCLWRGPAGRGRADHRGGKRTTECPGSAWKGEFVFEQGRMPRCGSVCPAFGRTWRGRIPQPCGSGSRRKQRCIGTARTSASRRRNTFGPTVSTQGTGRARWSVRNGRRTVVFRSQRCGRRTGAPVFMRCLFSVSRGAGSPA